MEDDYQPRPTKGFERKDTIGLLSRLVYCSIIVPLVAVGLVYVWVHIAGISLAQKDWKRIAFYVWGGTLIILPIFALRHRRADVEDRSSEQPSLFHVSSSRSPMDKWEQRNARRILLQVYFAAVLLPGAGVALAVGTLYGLDIPIEHRDWMLIVMIYLLSSFAVGARLAFGSRRERL